jgi:hypothetical protein
MAAVPKFRVQRSGIYTVSFALGASPCSGDMEIFVSKNRGDGADLSVTAVNQLLVSARVFGQQAVTWTGYVATSDYLNVGGVLASSVPGSSVTLSANSELTIALVDGAEGPTGPVGTGDRYQASTSSVVLSPSSGTVSFVIQGGLAYMAGNTVVVASAVNPTGQRFRGVVLSYVTATGAMTVTSISGIVGSFASATVYIVGLDGVEGPAGATGSTGAMGTGATGLMGPQGAQGATGPMGAQGIQGVQGAQGIQGPTGPTGARGADGAAGVAGAAGAQGIQGPTGPTGARGADGAAGAQGAQGAQGAAGATGASGLIYGAMDITDASELVMVDGSNSGSWGTLSAFPSGTQYYNIAASYNGRYVAAVGNSGFIQVSTDAGQTAAGRSTSSAWLGICMSNSGQRMAATMSGGNVFTSSDFGVTWTSRGTAQSWSTQGQTIAMSGDGRYIIAPTKSGYLYRSEDFGVTWSNVAVSGANTFVTCIAMSASGRYVVYGNGTDGLYISSDYGLTFPTTFTGMVNPYGVAMSASGQYITAVRYGGNAFVSNNYGASFSSVAVDSPNGPYNSCVSMSASGQLQVACSYGSNSNDYIYWSNNYGQSWSRWFATNNLTWYGVAVSRSGNRVYACVRGGNVYRISVDALCFNSIAPFPSATMNLGGTGRTWATVFAASGVVSTSDSNLKDSVPLPYGLREIEQVRTIKYKWKTQADLPDDDPAKAFEYYGFCADELRDVFPELVYDENKEAPVQMNYSEMLPVVVNAVKELKAANDALRAEKERLETRLGVVIEWLRNTQGFVVPREFSE